MHEDTEMFATERLANHMVACHPGVSQDWIASANYRQLTGKHVSEHTSTVLGRSLATHQHETLDDVAHGTGVVTAQAHYGSMLADSNRMHEMALDRWLATRRRSHVGFAGV
jgi:hypothetical protein